MVVFTCGHCGESVQKPKVEKHYMTKCRNRNPNLSCMDCFKDFFGNDYEQHTKCITEEQRYGGKGFVAKEKKGEQKQNAWVEMVQSVLDEQKDASNNVLRILETVSKHNNTPRKKPKFINFVKNVCGHKTNPKDMDAAWDMIAVKLSALSTQNKNQKTEAKNDEEDKLNESNKSENLSVAKLSISEHEDNVQPEDEPTANGDATEGKKSKKQKKEEKKRKKYEAELQSANDIPDDDVEEEKLSKKEKKKKNKAEAQNDIDNEDNDEEISKKMKRKRQDTINSGGDAAENGQDTQVTEKTKKKKPKQDVQEDEGNQHEQHTVNTVSNGDKTDRFPWHAVIMSVLEKKGPEVQFKRLQKKVLSEYYEVTGQDIDDRIVDKFIKRLRSAPNVRVDKNRVLLVQ